MEMGNGALSQKAYYLRIRATELVRVTDELRKEVKNHEPMDTL